MKLERLLSFNKIDDNKIIARYFSRYKLLSLLNDSELVFTNTKDFSDKRERTIHASFLWKTPEDVLDIKKQFLDVNKNRTNSYITCWTKYVTDNYALWKIYNKENDGVCIVTTVGKLQEALHSQNEIIFGEVNYIDESQPQKCPVLPVAVFDDCFINMLELFKIYPYEYEKEIRGIIYTKFNMDIKSLKVKVKLVDFIDKIILNPFADDIMINELKSIIVEKFDESIIDYSKIHEFAGQKGNISMIQGF